MVELRGVSKSFGSIAAVTPTDLAVRAGEFMTLLGPSGCGKTTLLRLISGFEQPDEGSVHLDGRDVTRLPPNRRDVNQVFQSYALFPHMNVRENVGFGLRMQRTAHSEAAARVKEVIELMGLGGCEDRRPERLSGGQRQRVALARAIVTRPSVLLLDEPLSALDAKLREQMQAELKGLQRRLGITFILVTHDQGEALAMSDRIAVLNLGRIEQIGSPAEIYGSPATDFVAGFVGESNRLVAERIDDGTGLPRVRVADLVEIELAAHQWPFGLSQAVISVRPERLRLAKERPAEAGAIEIRIRERTFHGAFERVRMESGSGVVLLATVPSGALEGFECAVGTLAWCVLRPESITVPVSYAAAGPAP